MQIDSFDTIQFQFTTGQIPPPFCYMYNLEVSEAEKDNIQATLKLEYFDREELSDDEIYEEGFSPDDNFSWQGALPAVWMDEIKNKLNSTNWRKKPAANDDGSELNIKVVNENHSELMQPADSRPWEIFIQEIIQAIFELSKREAPLLIKFTSKNAKTEDVQLEFEFSFANRHVQIKKSKNHQKSMNWEEGQKLLKYIFGIDYNPEEGKEKIPNKNCNYISPGDGYWYTLKSGEQSGKETSKPSKLVDLLLSYAT